ncbi:protein kinase [Mycolicibacterium boenickei]
MDDMHRQPDADIGVEFELSEAGLHPVQEVGRGGFGVVYRCTQPGLDRSVAVKVLTDEIDENRRRFVREQQAMGRLTGHPNIVPVLQVGETVSGHPYLVMPYCAGGSLRDRIAGHANGLPVEEVLRVGVKIAGALESAHRVGIVHRDVKPANIMLTDYAEPALTDFGISHVTGSGFRTATGIVIGSPAFAAPEVLSGEESTDASDVYGLGATLFCALTGHPLFERRRGENVMAQFLRVAADLVPDLRGHDVDDDLATLVEAAMTREPAGRPSAQTLGEWLQQLQARRELTVDEMVVHGIARSPKHVGGQPTLVAEAPHAEAQPRHRGRLPAPVGGIVGRGAALAELDGLLAESGLVMVTGIGGVGKTTLALTAAQRLAPSFSDGVWLFELAEIQDDTLLHEAVAAVLGLRDQPDRPLDQVIAEFLGGRQALLVFDNCEHVLDGVAQLTRKVLTACPRVKVLATSRELLNIEDESVLALPPLSYPDPDEQCTVDSLACHDALALFVERAQAAVSSFKLTENNVAAVAQICGRLDGLPLAIELAAVRVRAMSPQQIAEGLSDRYALLCHGRRGRPTRQQTLADCVQWSFDLCTPAQQQLWARLSVFAGSIDYIAAQQVCDRADADEEFGESIAMLVDKSILTRTEYDGVVRFRLLETLREYGRNQVEDTEDFLVLRRRHADWYRQLLRRARAEWYGPDQISWINRLTLEMSNLREALQFSLSDSPSSALQMATDMRELWVFHGMLGEGHRWLTASIDRALSAPTALRAEAIYGLAQIAVGRGDAGAADTRIAEARELLDVVDNALVRGYIDWIDGMNAMLRGDVERGCASCEHALAATDDFEVQGHSLIVLGWMLEMLDRPHEALKRFEEALTLAEARGDMVMLSHAMGGMGMGRLQLGQYDGAGEILRSALDIARRISDPWTGAQQLVLLGWLAVCTGDLEIGATLMSGSIAVSKSYGAQLPTFAAAGGFHEKFVQRARDGLGDERFDAAWDAGTQMSFHEAAALGLKETGGGVYV